MKTGQLAKENRGLPVPGTLHSGGLLLIAMFLAHADGFALGGVFA